MLRRLTIPAASFMADALNVLFRIIFRLEVKGLENVEAAGERCVIAVNHLSFLDAPVVLSVLERKPVFAINCQIGAKSISPARVGCEWR